MPYIHDTPPTTSPSRSPSPPPQHHPSSKSADLQPKSPASLRRIEHHESDVVVVGAGILGTALAITLARAPHNRSVTLLEKSLKEPDRIVGELLQPGGMSALKELGLEECLEEIDSIRVKGYEVIYYGEGVDIEYPEEAAGIAGRDRTSKRDATQKGGRLEGRSFHHGRFIRRLREVAISEPNISVVESTVTDIVRDEHTSQILGVNCLTKGEKDVWFGQLTVVADGYASKFRKEYIPRQVVSKSKFWGLELIDADLPNPMHGHVVLGDGAPVLLYQIGTHETRALVDVPEGLESTSTKNGGVKGHLRSVVLPSLPDRVKPSFEKALDEGKLRSMPNSFLAPSVNRTAGMVMLGDAMNMRHPLTGGGMTVAFNDVVLLRDLLHPDVVPDLGDTRTVLKQMEAFHWKRKNLTSVINVLAQALYSLFAANGTFLTSSLPYYWLTKCPYRSSTQSPPAWLLSLLSARRPMYRWTCWSTWWNPTPAHATILSLLLRRLACYLACDLPILLDRPTAGAGVVCGHLLQGLRGIVSLYLLRAEKLR